jgi:hypothetical protein
MKIGLITSLKLAVVTTVMLAAVVACGRKGDAKTDKAADKVGETTTTSANVAKASCNMLTELGTCNEYQNGSSFGLEKSLCEGFKGKFANTGCSTEGQIGSCLMSEGEVKRYYGSKAAGDHALTVEEAKSDCESELVKGKFTPDPNAAAANPGVAPQDPKPATPAAKAAAKPKKK